MSGKCLEYAMIYKATVSSKDKEKFYFGATVQTFKKRYPKHKEAIHKKNSTASTYFGVLMTKEETPKLSGKFSRSATPMLADLELVTFV